MASSNEKWRLLNLQSLSYLETQTIYHALALAQHQYDFPNTLVICWPDRPFACIGLHQIKEKTIDLTYLEKKKIPYVRRVTGGGSVYLDSNQVFYQIICRETDYPQRLQEFYKLFLRPVISTYRHFGIPAEYSPINDILALNKKISGNGAVTIEKSRILVGNFILDFSTKEMARILKVPEEKFRDKIEKKLENVMGSFEYFLGYIPDRVLLIHNFVKEFQNTLKIDLEQGKLELEEKKILSKLNKQYQSDEWLNYVEPLNGKETIHKLKSDSYIVFSEEKFKGGLVQLYVYFVKNVIREIVISGDFTINRPMLLEKVQEELTSLEVDYELLFNRLTLLFKENNIDIPGIEITELVNLILIAYNKVKDKIE